MFEGVAICVLVEGKYVQKSHSRESSISYPDDFHKQKA